MKRIPVSLCLSIFVTSLIPVVSIAESLPVLRVTYPGSGLKNDVYLQGEMKLELPDGVVVELPAQFKTRGATALSYTMKPSFNMKLRDAEDNEIDSTLLDIRRSSSYILDAMAIDRICMRNRVCFDIWNSFSKLPYETDFGSRNGTEGKFVEVYMNDVYKGIYCLSDKINRKLLDLKKPQVESDGSVTIRGLLYKQGTTDIGDQNTEGFFNDYSVCVIRWHDAWELHEPDDYPCYEAWVPLINLYDNEADYNYVKKHFHTDNIVDYTLFVMALSINDNWGNKNKYYSIQNSTKSDEKGMFLITPWDLDTSLGGSYNGTLYDGNYSDWKPSDMMKVASGAIATCMAQSENKEKLKARWIETRKEVFSVESVAKRMYDYCELFEKTGAWNRYVEYWNERSSRPCYVDDLRAEIDKIVEWYSARHDEIDAYFGISGSSVESVLTDSGEADSTVYNLQGMPVDETHLVKGNIYISRKGKFVAH